MNFVPGRLIVTVCIMAKLITTAEYNISTSCTPMQSSCVTLSNFVFPTIGNVLINFLPGVHYLSNAVATIRNRDMFVIVGTLGETSIGCYDLTYYYRAHLTLERVTKIRIENMTFNGCKLKIRESNGIYIYRSLFLNSLHGAIEFLNSFNASIDRSSFRNNKESSFAGVLHFRQCDNLQITRCNFTNNTVSSSSSGIVYLIYSSTGLISGSNFHNNSALSFGGIITTGLEGNFLFITNSSFTSNYVADFGGIIDIGASDSTVVISCVFSSNSADSYSASIQVSYAAYVTVLASKFINNRCGAVIKTYSYYRKSRVVVDCTHFFNNSRSFDAEPNTLSLYNSTSCTESYLIGEEGTCISNENCQVYRPPNATVTLEFREYTVNENIRSDNYALLVCVQGLFTPYLVHVSINFANGSAKENADFIPVNSDCRDLGLTNYGGNNNACTMIEILNDNEIELSEYFFIKLRSEYYITFIVKEAVVTIVDDDSQFVTTATASVASTGAITTDAVTTNAVTTNAITADAVITTNAVTTDAVTTMSAPNTTASVMSTSATELSMDEPGVHATCTRYLSIAVAIFLLTILAILLIGCCIIFCLLYSRKKRILRDGDVMNMRDNAAYGTATHTQDPIYEEPDVL